MSMPKDSSKNKKSVMRTSGLTDVVLIECVRFGTLDYR